MNLEREIDRLLPVDIRIAPRELTAFVRYHALVTRPPKWDRAAVVAMLAWVATDELNALRVRRTAADGRSEERTAESKVKKHLAAAARTLRNADRKMKKHLAAAACILREYGYHKEAARILREHDAHNIATRLDLIGKKTRLAPRPELATVYRRFVPALGDMLVNTLGVRRQAAAGVIADLLRRLNILATDTDRARQVNDINQVLRDAAEGNVVRTRKESEELFVTERIRAPDATTVRTDR